MMWKFLAFKCNKLFLFDFWILERFLISFVLTLKQRCLDIKVLLSANLIFLEHLIAKISSAKISFAMNFLSEGSYKMMLRDYFVFVYLDNDVICYEKSRGIYNRQSFIQLWETKSRYFKQRATCFMHKMGWWGLTSSGRLYRNS